MKKLLSLMLCAVLLASCLVIPAAAETQEKPTVTMLCKGDNNPPDDNDVLVELRARTGVNLQVIYVSSADYTAKLNTMLASDTLPDIFSVGGQDLLDLAAAEKMIDIEPYLADDGPHILETMEEKNIANRDGLDQTFVNTFPASRCPVMRFFYACPLRYALGDRPVRL